MIYIRRVVDNKLDYEPELRDKEFKGIFWDQQVI